jgi:dihydrofolate reductase
VSNFDEAIKKGKEYAHNNKIDELFIIGGGLIYKQAIDMVDRLYVTKVDINIDGDTYFPKIDEKIWKLDSDKKEDDYDKISKKNVKITIEKWIKK